jgi:PAS domain S-box-containing protein
MYRAKPWGNRARRNSAESHVFDTCRDPDQAESDAGMTEKSLTKRSPIASENLLRSIARIKLNRAPLAGPIGAPSDGPVGRAPGLEPIDGEMHTREHFHRELLEALPAAIYTTDAAGRITFYNQAAVDLAGRRPEVGSDRWCVSWRLFWPDGTPMAHDECPMAIALKENRAIRGAELIVERPDGARVSILPHPTPLHDTSGKLVGAVNMLMDLSDRKKAEEVLHQLNAMLEQRVEQRTQQLQGAFARLRDSERGFRGLVQGVTDYAIFMLDPEGVVTNWNAGAQRIKGYTADEIIGQHFSRFYTPKDRAEGMPQRALATAAREGKFEAEGWRVRKDGKLFWASIVIDPIRDEDGTLVGFAKVTRDITERREAQEALAESAELARGIIDTALDAFVQIDDTGTVMEWNAQAETIFGWSRQEAVGKSLATLILPSSERARHQKGLEHFRQTGRGRILGQRVRMQALRRDGKEIPVELSITALRRGERHLFNGFIRDLTEKLAAEEQLHHALKMEAIGQLTGGVAHDFNNLLTAIIGNLEVLATRVPAHGSAARLIEAALGAAWRGSGLTEQLLAFSRRQEIRPEIVDVDRLLHNALFLCQKTVGEGIDVAVHCQEDLWRCRVDPGQFEAALLNLAANARDAMNRSGTLTITASNLAMGGGNEIGLAAGEYVEVSVTDTGCGMSKEVLARAFEPFYTTKEVGKGTGLGLSQVQSFAKQGGGTVRIESEKGNGTTVRVYLPKAEGRIGSETSSPVMTPAPSGGATILVVEDNSNVREMITEVLSPLGYHTMTAASAAEALAMLRRESSVELLLSDVVLPGGSSGIDLARTARKLKPELKVLLSSGYVGDEARHDLARGEFAFLSKPYRPAELAANLAEVLAKP